jgi:SAM-dependent methyltransferase
MLPVDPKAHWDRIYAERSPSEVSWYQSEPTLSLELLRRSGIARDRPIIDVGGGASSFVDRLLATGYQRIAVLDISVQALRHAQARLGAAAERVEWYGADVTTFSPPHGFALWHDRAVFHFLTEAQARRDYVDVLERTLLPDGQVIIAAFGIGGPTRCSGLEVVQYDAAALGVILGEGFHLVDTLQEIHLTPRGASQLFGYHRFARRQRSTEKARPRSVPPPCPPPG